METILWIAGWVAKIYGGLILGVFGVALVLMLAMMAFAVISCFLVFIFCWIFNR